jgi:hypothetical protein
MATPDYEMLDEEAAPTEGEGDTELMMLGEKIFDDAAAMKDRVQALKDLVTYCMETPAEYPEEEEVLLEDEEAAE